MKTIIYLQKISLAIFIVALLLTSCKKEVTENPNLKNVNATCPLTVKDAEGNTYNVVKIGNQCWMAENLKTKHYNDGDTIATTYPDTLNIINASHPKYQWAYNGDENNVATYGRLYTWYAITDGRGICPAGWRVPTKDDFDTLTNYLGKDVAGSKLKESGNTHWQTYEGVSSNNSSGFNALPAGIRRGNYQGSLVAGSYKFESLGRAVNFWGSTNAPNTTTHPGKYHLPLFYYSNNASCDYFFGEEDNGYSVRLVMDAQ
jgi:uncharacterized protein (TIGR02145 family)